MFDFLDIRLLIVLVAMSIFSTAVISKLYEKINNAEVGDIKQPAYYNYIRKLATYRLMISALTATVFALWVFGLVYNWKTTLFSSMVATLLFVLPSVFGLWLESLKIPKD